MAAILIPFLGLPIALICGVFAVAYFGLSLANPTATILLEGNVQLSYLALSIVFLLVAF